jgi:hypothetical protein
MVESAEICDVTHPEFVNHLSMNKPNTTGIITNQFDVVGISITCERLCYAGKYCFVIVVQCRR